MTRVTDPSTASSSTNPRQLPINANQTMLTKALALIQAAVKAQEPPEQAVDTGASTTSGMKPIQAAAKMASYMRDSGITSINLKDLRNLAEDPATPASVKEAAQYFLDNDPAFAAVDANSGVDGEANVGDFEAAAHGQLNHPKPTEQSEITSPAIPNVQTASGAAVALANYISSTGENSYDLAGLKALVDNPEFDEIPPSVRQAAKYFINNPDDFLMIAGTDGRADFADFNAFIQDLAADALNHLNP